MTWVLLFLAFQTAVNSCWLSICKVSFRLSLNDSEKGKINWPLLQSVSCYVSFSYIKLAQSWFIMFPNYSLHSDCLVEIVHSVLPSRKSVVICWTKTEPMAFKQIIQKYSVYFCTSPWSFSSVTDETQTRVKKTLKAPKCHSLRDCLFILESISEYLYFCVSGTKQYFRNAGNVHCAWALLRWLFWQSHPVSR